jgi:hypothetical protein
MADSKNVLAASIAEDNESFFSAPLGTPLPTDAVEVFDTDFVGHGWLGDEGVKNKIQRDTTDHYDLSGQLIKTTQDKYSETVTLVFCETNPEVLKTIFGDDNVDVDYTSGHLKMTVRHDDKPLDRKSFLVRLVEGQKTTLHVIPEGQVTEIEEIPYSSTDLTVYGATVKCYKPADGEQPDNPKAVNTYYDFADVLDGS